jgi:hypothetical protein
MVKPLSSGKQSSPGRALRANLASWMIHNAGQGTGVKVQK